MEEEIEAFPDRQHDFNIVWHMAKYEKKGMIGDKALMGLFWYSGEPTSIVT